MLKILLTHEIQNLLKSKRVYWTILMFLVLFASVFIVRVIDYQKQLNQYIADTSHVDETLQNAANYSHINPMPIQQPIIFSIYNQGFSFPRVISIRFYEPIISTTSINEVSNIIYTKNTRLDITFLVSFFLSLFILLITYDSINGEKQDGTLRLIMTFPLKRQSFILKKILGVFILVAVTFTLPFMLSLFCLIVIYANLLTINFFLSAFFYWFLVILFIFFFLLLGIFISACSGNPSRSLVYSLLIWILFAIVLPTSWKHIISPMIYDDSMALLNQNYEDKYHLAQRIFNLEDLDETKYNAADLNIHWGSYWHWSGGPFYSVQIWSHHEMYEARNRRAKYTFDEYYPVSMEVEQAMDQVYRKRISIENAKNWIFFFDPIVLFENLSMKITGNSREDHLKFLHDARIIRADLVNLGIYEGWLLDWRFYARYNYEITHALGGIWEYYTAMEENPDLDHSYPTYDEAENNLFIFDTPTINRYSQPIFTFGEIFERIWVYLGMFVGSIVVLWLFTWWKFMRYDVR